MKLMETPAMRDDAAGPQPGPRTAWPVRTLRKHPYVYSAVCKARLAYSRRIAAVKERTSYRQNQARWTMSSFEKTHYTRLTTQGFTLIEDFVPSAIVDAIFAKADEMFTNLHLDFQFGYSVQNSRRKSLEGIPYEQLRRTEKVISLNEPLVAIPECLPIAFDERLLKIVTNFLGYVPPSYQVTVVRDFAHNRPLESSNFHKDNDEADSVQIFAYLVDINDDCGHLVYVPRTNRYDPDSCRPRLNRDLGIAANDGRYSDEEIGRYYPPETWARLRTKRGGVAIIHGNGIHKGPCWPDPGRKTNHDRTAIKIDINGYKMRSRIGPKNNVMTTEQFISLNDVQKLFAHAQIRQDAAGKNAA